VLALTVRRASILLEMKNGLRRQWGELREAAWDWDPLGLAMREWASDEYDCLIEQIVPLLERGADVPEIVTHFDVFVPEHFGTSTRQGSQAFAEAAIKWWRRH